MMETLSISRKLVQTTTLQDLDFGSITKFYGMQDSGVITNFMGLEYGIITIIQYSLDNLSKVLGKEKVYCSLGTTP